MFESLTESLGKVFRNLAGKGRLTEKNIEEGMREVRLALLAADVHFKVVKDFIDRVTKKAVGEEVLKGINPGQLVIKIVHDELVDLMGPVDHALPTGGKRPGVIMLAGLQGSGKTTTTAKLARYLVKKGRRPLMVAADLFRAAAIDQLKTLGEQLKVPVYSEPQGRAVKICERGVLHAEANGYDIVLLDTQGRLHVDAELMDELVDIKAKVRPDQVLLVVDGMTGQDAVKSADSFNQKLSVDGVILTKLDGDARGGAALSVKAVTGKPIKFLGVGEKLDGLEEFHPDRLAGRILGMGDVVSLVEKAQEAFDQEKAKKLQDKIRKDELTLGDFLEQLQQMKKLGSLKDVMKMMPGMGEMAKDVNDDELKHSEAIIQSMTPQERESPEILNSSRRRRVAEGSGRAVHEVNALIKQFDEARRMLKGIKKRGGFGQLFGG